MAIRKSRCFPFVWKKRDQNCVTVPLLINSFMILECVFWCYKNLSQDEFVRCLIKITLYQPFVSTLLVRDRTCFEHAPNSLISAERALKISICAFQTVLFNTHLCIFWCI